MVCGSWLKNDEDAKSTTMVIGHGAACLPGGIHNLAKYVATFSLAYGLFLVLLDILKHNQAQQPKPDIIIAAFVICGQQTMLSGKNCRQISL